MRVWPGQPYPFGATWTGLGVNFAIFSAHATGVDPYAKSIRRLVRWDDSVGYTIGDPDGDLSFDTRDNAAYATLAVVIDPAFTGGDDRPPRTPWHKTVIYEMHVRGFTTLHPNVPEPLGGTYEALTREAAIEHLQRLGVTAVELMPVHHHAYDRHLVERGLSNYWGYNMQAFVAPDIRYSASGHPDDSVREFKGMVKALHSAGLEVILDVVYNHTAEGDHLGPTRCQDNEISWTCWRLLPEERDFLEFTRRLVHYRRSQPTLTRRKYFQGRSIRGADVKDIYWLDPSGREMTDEAWNAPFVRSLGVPEARFVGGTKYPLQGRTVVLFWLEKHRPYRRPSDHEARERMALQVTR